MAAAKWTRLIRFINSDITYNGEPVFAPGQNPHEVVEIAEAGLLRARVIKHDVFSEDAYVTEQELPVEKLLGPLTQHQVPIIRCVGLNYMKHSS